MEQGFRFTRIAVEHFSQQCHLLKSRWHVTEVESYLLSKSYLLFSPLHLSLNNKKTKKAFIRILQLFWTATIKQSFPSKMFSSSFSSIHRGGFSLVFCFFFPLWFVFFFATSLTRSAH